jgi:hypothetical protein
VGGLLEGFSCYLNLILNYNAHFLVIPSIDAPRCLYFNGAKLSKLGKNNGFNFVIQTLKAVGRMITTLLFVTILMVIIGPNSIFVIKGA